MVNPFMINNFSSIFSDGELGLLFSDDFFLNLFQKVADSLRRHTYSNILKDLQPKIENFQIKNLIFFIFLLKT